MCYNKVEEVLVLAVLVTGCLVSKEKGKGSHCR